MQRVALYLEAIETSGVKMLIGYARTSTSEQVAGLQAQLRDLDAVAGCTKIFSEQVSSVGQRAQLDAALEFVREGDTLCVTKLDRLARSTAHLLSLVDFLEGKGVALRILDFDRWYVSNAGLKAADVVQLWHAAEQQALAEGYGGLRITGNTSFVGPDDWDTFLEYEHLVTEGLRGRRGILHFVDALLI